MGFDPVIMIVHQRGFGYYILLKETLDYFDDVLELQKQTRTRVVCQKADIDKDTLPQPIQNQLNVVDCSETDNDDYVRQDVLKMVTQVESDDRLLRSRYYESQKQTWFACGQRLDRALASEQIPDVVLTPAEIKVVDAVLQHRSVKDNAIYQGWFDCVQFG